ncbi:hypothetical protein K490DRAFT_64187 [Saccharata proteae CBS 121410]|uniref:Amidoligase enzyme-domain-containing protein n=1 Tax=Saccharata proteae CBS 121410 TaxID=1314787 RepID=A0A6A5YDT2_9PEZI|nr:hypothetical protein K490DRAFT_64187 [Saccharata proteae CBS 121410]
MSSPKIYSATNPPPLTFGVEIEFVLYARDESGLANRLAVHSALLAANLAVHPHDPNQQGNDGDYTKWEVQAELVPLETDEARQGPGMNGGWFQCGTEIVSRVFRYSDRGWRREVDAAIRAIKSVEGPGRRVLVGEGCGFHVHVGIEGGVGFGVLKRLMQVHLGFERAVDELMSAERVESFYCAGNSAVFARANPPMWDEVFESSESESLRGSSSGDSESSGDEVVGRLAGRGEIVEIEEVDEDTVFVDCSVGQGSPMQVEPSAGTDALSWIRYVRDHMHSFHDAETDDLHKHAWTNKMRSLNLRGFSSENGSSRSLAGTIEFRQHRGTCDAEEISAWVDVVCSITRFAATTSQEFLDVFFEMHVFNPFFTGLDFLKLISAPPAAIAYYEKKLTREAIQEDYHRAVDANYPADLKNIVQAIEAKRLWFRDPLNVRSMILQRMDSGKMGTFPKGFRKALQKRYMRELTHFNPLGPFSALKGELTNSSIRNDDVIPNNEYAMRIWFKYRLHTAKEISIPADAEFVYGPAPPNGQKRQLRARLQEHWGHKVLSLEQWGYLTGQGTHQPEFLESEAAIPGGDPLRFKGEKVAISLGDLHLTNRIDPEELEFASSTSATIMSNTTTATTLLLALLTLSAHASPQQSLSPFVPGLNLLEHFPQHALLSAIDANANATTTPPPTPTGPNLHKRTGTTCPTSYSACSALGAPGLCCKRNTNCAVDQAGHVACCPKNAACTGTIGGASVTASASYGESTSTYLGGGTTTTDTDGASTTQPFIVVASTVVATPNAAGGRAMGGVPFEGLFGRLW